ncbi:MAG: MmpS family transport accessory protein [Actinomycetota bacterium]
MWAWFRNLHWIGKTTIFVFLLMALTVIWISGGFNGSEQKHSVSYIVTGSAQNVSITYTNENGWTEETETKLPWSWHSNKVPSGSPIYIMAQNNGVKGSILVRIEVDGKTFKKSTAAGPFNAVTINTYLKD